MMEGGATYDGGLLSELLCGEVADDYGNTVPASEAWERDDTDPEILYCNGGKLDSPTNRNELNFKIRWNGWTGHSNQDVGHMQGSFKIREDSYGGVEGEWSSWSDDAGRILTHYPNDGLGPIAYVNYLISVTEDRTIIVTQGTFSYVDASYVGHTCVLYVGTFETYADPTKEKHPFIIASSHCAPYELYRQGNGIDDGNHIYLASAGNSGSMSGTPSLNLSRFWIRKGIGQSCKLMTFADDRDGVGYIQPKTGSWNGGIHQGNELPLPWLDKWFMYPFFILSADYGQSIWGSVYPVGQSTFRGRLLDLYAFPTGKAYDDPGFDDLDILSDGDQDYRLIIPSSVTYSSITSPPYFGRSVNASLAMLQI